MLTLLVRDLSCYNNSILFSVDISLPLAVDELNDSIQEMLSNGQKICEDSLPHQEWAIHDYEWEEESLFSISEFDDIYELNKRVSYIQGTVQSDQLKILKFLLENFGMDLETAIDNIENVNVYEDCDLEDVVEQYLEDCYNLDDLPSIISSNINYESIANDWRISGQFFEIDSDIYEYVG